MIMGKRSYYLSKHTFFCLADNHFVFLDLRCDQYLCLGHRDTELLKGLLNDRPLGDGSSASLRVPDAKASSVVEVLLKKQLIVAGESTGKLPVPVRVDAPVASVIDGSNDLRGRTRSAHLWKFLSAATTASMNLRWQSIEVTVRAIESRKSAHAGETNAANEGRITELFEIFTTLRPYYPRPYLCMFDSLALLHFLAHFGVFPSWVYGVKLEPFGAHCWVQEGNLVVNDTIDHVRQYTPIMSI